MTKNKTIRNQGDLIRGRHRFRVIDLFSGAGGMSLGFTRLLNGNYFQTIWANEINEPAASTYNANFGNHCVVGNIVDLLENPKIKIPSADVVIGGPPCQGFSLLNKKRDKDPRKQLWRPFLEVVRRSSAHVFVMENVPQLLGSLEHEEIRAEANNMGFQLASYKLCAADYGVPQVRWRAFIVGCSFTDPALFFPPKKTHYNPNNGYKKGLFSEQSDYAPNAKPWRTVRDSISDLPEPKGVEIRDVPPPLDIHFGRSPSEISIKRYQSIPHEGMNRYDLRRLAPELTPPCWMRVDSCGTDIFGRLWWDRPASTMRTEFYKPEKGRYLHPSKHRPITHREAARFQSFPDDFRFCGKKVQIAIQIGNAVPPLLAAEVAKCTHRLLSLMDKEKRGGHLYTGSAQPSNGARQDARY